MLSYRSIEELQQQNEKLLAVVRELSDAQEGREKETVDIHTKVHIHMYITMVTIYSCMCTSPWKPLTLVLVSLITMVIIRMYTSPW